MNLPPLLGQALALHQSGRFGEAEPLYLQFLSAAPKDYLALHLMGLLRLQQGRLPEALIHMESALAVQPNAADTLANYAIALSSLGRSDEALAALDKALAAQPGNSRFVGNRGGIKARLGRLQDALADFEQALKLDPRNLDALLNRGLMLQQLQQPALAQQCLDQFLVAAPGHGEARLARGLALRALGRGAEALADFDWVIAANPGHAGAHVNRASQLWAMERLDEALAAYAAALSIEPNNLAALESRANLLWTRRQALAPALADLERVVQIKPDQPYALGNLLHLKMHAGDWKNYDADLARLNAAVRAGVPAVLPFIYQALSQSPADLMACAQSYAAREFPVRPAAWREKPRRPGPIRIGYVCGEFRAQATMYLAAGLFESHDRKNFEVIGFDNGRDDQSPMRARVVAGFDKFISIAALSDDEAAARIVAEDIDILVNLNGYFGKMRMEVFARRPAPLQVSYLGFPGTLGAAYMDYILADPIVVPPEQDAFYTEQVVRLPGSYQVNDNKRAAIASTSRAAHGLPQDALVLCHFNYGYKITPALFACWMRILSATPDAVLWLLAGDALLAENLKRRAAEHGVDPARLIFAPPLEWGAHLARLGLADLFLDSFICNAHTTASDALWAGLPLVTLQGEAFSGRVAASLLTAVGLPELIAQTEESYENLILELAKNSARRAALREKLAQMKSTAPLFDTARTTRHIEAAFEKMQALRLGGEAPQGFAVTP